MDALFDAVLRGDLGFVRTQVKDTTVQQNINSINDTTGENALFTACRLGHVAVVKVLLGVQGITVDPKKTSVSGTTVLDVATTSSATQVVSVLLSYGTPITDSVRQKASNEIQEVLKIFETSGKDGLAGSGYTTFGDGDGSRPGATRSNSKIENLVPAADAREGKIVRYTTHFFERSPPATTAITTSPPQALKGSNPPVDLVTTMLSGPAFSLKKMAKTGKEEKKKSQAILNTPDRGTRTRGKSEMVLPRAMSTTPTKDPNDLTPSTDGILASFTGKVIEYNDVKLGDEIGAGGYAAVFKGVHENVEVAIKKMHFTKPKKPREVEAAQRVIDEFIHEIAIQGKLSHPNLVNIIGISVEPLCVVMDLVSQGDLFKYLHDPKKSITMKFKIAIATDIAKGLHYMHDTMSPPIIHVDMKSLNILLNTEQEKPGVANAKVTDFGTAKEFIGEKFTGRFVDNPTWLAPEAIADQPWDMGVDVYGYGVILWELLTRKEYFGECRFWADIEDSIKDGKRPPIDPAPPQFQEIIEKCWAQDPASRPPWSWVLSKLDEMSNPAFDLQPWEKLQLDKDDAFREKIRKEEEEYKRKIEEQLAAIRKREEEEWDKILEDVLVEAREVSVEKDRNRNPAKYEQPQFFDQYKAREEARKRAPSSRHQQSQQKSSHQTSDDSESVSESNGESSMSDDEMTNTTTTKKKTDKLSPRREKKPKKQKDYSQIFSTSMSAAPMARGNENGNSVPNGNNNNGNNTVLRQNFRKAQSNLEVPSQRRRSTSDNSSIAPTPSSPQKKIALTILSPPSEDKTRKLVEPTATLAAVLGTYCTSRGVSPNDYDALDSDGNVIPSDQQVGRIVNHEIRLVRRPTQPVSSKASKILGVTATTTTTITTKIETVEVWVKFESFDPVPISSPPTSSLTAFKKLVVEHPEFKSYFKSKVDPEKAAVVFYISDLNKSSSSPGTPISDLSTKISDMNLSDDKVLVVKLAK